MRTDRPSSIDRTVRRGGDARGVLRVAAETRGASLSELSRAIGRSPSYLSRYVDRRVPAALNDNDRSDLALYLGISADLLA